MIHSYDVVGYTADADTYCPQCAASRYGSTREGTLDREGNELGAIFADSEWDCSPPSCSDCGGVLEAVSVIHYYDNGVCKYCGDIADA